MINIELINYIRDETTKGHSNDTIKQALMVGGGWTEADVEEAFKALHPLATPEPKISKPIANPTMPSVPVPPVVPVPPFANFGFASPVPELNRTPGFVTATPTPPIGNKKSHKTAWVALIFIFLLCAIAFALWYFFSGEIKAVLDIKN